MAYTLGNKCAKNCCKRTIPVQLIVEDVVTCFLEHSVVTSAIHTALRLNNTHQRNKTVRTLENTQNKM